jgi:aminoglycoside 3-N-acetyltransferase
MNGQAMASRALSRAEVTRQIRVLGVQPGGVLLVHTAFSKVAPIEGGPRGLIEALLTALGPAGTLVMPSMTHDDDHPFDPRETPCVGMGIVADTFWRMQGVRRSASPHAFAAIGPAAPAITAPHPVDVPHGLDSPVAASMRSAGTCCCSEWDTKRTRPSIWPKPCQGYGTAGPSP